MCTVVLQSQDYLRDRLCHESVSLTPSSTPCRSPKSCSNPISNASRLRRRKRSPVGFQSTKQQPAAAAEDRSLSRGMVVKAPAKKLVMGDVKILKRGESLCLSREDERQKEDCEKKESDLNLDLVLGSADRLGPEPEFLQKHIRFLDCVYAGSGCFMSPSPSCLPVPCFLGRNDSDSATEDLRRLLRLDLL